MRKTHDHEWWLSYIEEYKSSGESIREYCRQKGLSYDAFWWQLKKEKKSSRDYRSSNAVEIMPVTVIEHPQECLSITVNGVDISGNTSDIQKLLGIRQ